MTAPGGFLDFFILEASDYIDQIDALLLTGDARVDAEALQRLARALRGSSTMAKMSGLSGMAAGIERVGRAVREGQLQWTPALRGVVVSAIDDLKVLLRNVRTWNSADDARARVRIDELIRYAPIRPPTPLATPTTAGHDTYLATEATNIGAGLELLATRPSDRDAATNVLKRVRALRGIASVRDHASLADILEAAEQAARPLELGESTLSPERVALLNAAATVLRSVSAAMRAGTSINQTSPDLTRFAAALDAMQERQTGADRVVPIREFFYEDGGETLVEAAANPPTSPAQRFRLEVVSQGEHLRRVVSDARAARDDLARERVRRALRQALRSLRQAAESFGEQDVAEFVESHADDVVELDARALDSLEDVATLLAQPSAAGGTLGERLRSIQEARTASHVTSTTTSAAASVDILATTRAAPGDPAAPPHRAPPSHILTPILSSSAIAPPSTLPQERDRPAAVAMATVATSAAAVVPRAASALVGLLDVGIRSLNTLRNTPLTPPVTIDEQPPIPIERLLYRGRAAIERAREIREDVRTESGPVDVEKLQELFDLLDLALVT